MVSYIQVPQYGVEQGFKGIIKAEDSPRRSNLPSDIWNEFKPVHGEQISGIYRPSEQRIILLLILEVEKWMEFIKKLHSKNMLIF